MLKRTVFFLALAFVVSGCYKEIVYDENPFLIKRKELIFSALESTSTVLFVGGTAQLTVSADGDSLTYEWTTDAGEIIASGKTASFTNNEVGNAEIVCNIVDLYGNSSSKTISIYATYELQFESLWATDSIFPIDFVTTLTPNASGDQVAFEWRTSGGVINIEGEKALFQTSTKGPYTVWCKVTDFNGVELTKEILLQAVEGFVYKKLQADRLQMKPGENINIEAIVLGNDTEYEWKTIPPANILGSGSKVVFTICHSDVFEVFCTVRDKNGNVETKSVRIHVG